MKAVISLLTNKIFMVIVAVIVLLVVVYFMFYKDKKDTTDKKEVLDALSVETSTQTFTLFEYETMADVIHNSLRFGGISDSKPKAEKQLLKLETLKDILLLIKAYGKRQRHIFGLNDGSPVNLVETINDEFFQWRINKVNKAFKNKGIDFKF